MTEAASKRKYIKKSFGDYVAAVPRSTAESALMDLTIAIERLYGFQKSLMDRIDVTVAVGQLQAFQHSLMERIDGREACRSNFISPHCKSNMPFTPTGNGPTKNRGGLVESSRWSACLGNGSRDAR